MGDAVSIEGRIAVDGSATRALTKYYNILLQQQYNWIPIVSLVVHRIDSIIGYIKPLLTQQRNRQAIMSHPNYSESTKVQREAFYQFLCTAFDIAKDQYQLNGNEVPLFIQEWETFKSKSSKQPSLKTLVNHFSSYVTTKGTNEIGDMGTILEVVASNLPNFW